MMRQFLFNKAKYLFLFILVFLSACSVSEEVIKSKSKSMKEAEYKSRLQIRALHKSRGKEHKYALYHHDPLTRQVLVFINEKDPTSPCKWVDPLHECKVIGRHYY